MKLVEMELKLQVVPESEKKTSSLVPVKVGDAVA